LSGPIPFQILMSGSVREQVVEAIQVATLAGLRTEALAAARVIERGLTWYADGLGESRGNLHDLGTHRWAKIGLLCIWYAVHVGRREAQISQIYFVPLHPLKSNGGK